MNQIKFISFFFLLSFINLISSSYVTIPFKIMKENEPSIYSSIEDYFSFNSNLQYYGEISIGEISYSIPVFLSFNDFGFYFVSKGTNLGNLNQVYDPSFSSSFHYENNSFYYFRNNGISHKSYKAYDTFNFNDALKCKRVKFLYCNENHDMKNSYMTIGLRLLGDIIRDSDLNLVKQLRQNKYTETYDWSLHFDEKDKNKGILLIGGEAHKYKPNKFNQSYYLNSVTLSKEVFDVWNLFFDKIYFLNNNNEEMKINDYMRFTLKHDSNLIVGTPSYEKLIKQYFFDDLISQQKCQMETSKVHERVYTCTNTEKIKSELKKKFPVLKIESKAYMMTFELTYDDLFLEKNDKIYFLVYFGYYAPFSWEVGLPFLQKYFFNYNYDTNLIYFYNNDLAKFNESEKPESNKGKVAIVIILIILFGFLGFYLGRKYILMRRIKRIRAEELENDFSKKVIDENDNDYEMNKTEYMPNKNDKNVSKYFLI